MSAKIEVVFVDEGSTIPELPATTPFSAPPVGAPGPADRVPGAPRWKGTPKDSGPDSSQAGADFRKAAEMAAAAVGAGGLAKQAFTLTDAFGKLYRAVTASAERIEDPRGTVTIEDIGRGVESLAGPAGDTDLSPLPDATERLLSPGAGRSDTDLNDAMRAAMENVFGPGRGGVVAGPSGGNGIPATAGGAIRVATTAAPAVAGAAARAGAAGGAAGVGGAAGGAGAAGAGGLAGLAAAAGPAAIAVAALTAAVVGGVIVIKKAWDTLASEADRLSGLSGPLSAATASSGIRAEMADLLRASQIGPQLARFEDVRGRAMEKLADVQTKVLQVLLQWFEASRPLIEGLLAVAPVAGASLPVMSDALLSLLQAQQGNLAALALTAEEMKNIKLLAKELVKLAKDRQEDELGGRDPFMDAFLAEFQDERKARPGARERADAFRRHREAGGQGQPFQPEGA